VDRIRTFHRRYTPDFLIRHRQTHETYLIEIKACTFQFQPQLKLRQRIAENFIGRENLDWAFKIVYDDEIILTSDQLEAFEQCFRLKSRNDRKAWFDEYCKKISRANPQLSNFTSENKRIQFLMFGTTNIGQPRKWRSL
jgi:ribosomal protein L16/L10AE